MLEDATATLGWVQTVSEVQGNDVKANWIQAASSSAGAPAVSSSASVTAQLCLQNMSTGACYVLQPVAKASPSYTQTFTISYTDNSSPTALMRQVMQSPPSVRLFVSTVSSELSDC